ncbi:MAG: hypothetical protein WAS21_15060 [Geminicoccaceae bacterium]|jgi:hypothetical protein
MAARRVSLGYLSTAVLLSVGAAVATFQLKYAVRNVEGELATVRAQIAREREVVQSARADLAYLTRPDRLVMQAAQLGMVPARGERLLAASQLPGWDQLQWARLPVQATLPSGAGIELRSKPVPAMMSLGLGLD